MSIEVLGLDRVISRLVRMEEALDKDTEKEMKSVAELIRDFAKRIVPVDTGSLRQSIRLQVYAQQATYIKRIGVSAGGYITNPKTGRKVDYARYIEFGTSKIFPRYFMRTATRQYTPLFPKKIRDMLIE